MILSRHILFAMASASLVLAGIGETFGQSVSGRVLLTNSEGVVQGEVPSAWVVICRDNRILTKQDKLGDHARFDLNEADGRAFDLVVGAPDMTPATYRGLVVQTDEKLVLSVTVQRISETMIIPKSGRKAVDRKVADALEVLPANSEEARVLRQNVERLDQKRVVSILIPAYFYPGGNTGAEWEDVLRTAVQFKADARLIVVVNVNNGPGDPQMPDVNYQNLITQLARNDAIVVGYIHCDYGRRGLKEMQQEVLAWISTYPGLSGLFFDEVPSDKKDVAPFKSLCESSRKALKGVKQPMIVGNFGTACDEAYAAEGVFDHLCISDSKWGDHKIERPSWDRQNSRAKYGAILYGLSDKKDFTAAFDLITAAGMSFVYFSDQTGAGNEVLWTRLPQRNEIWNPLIQKTKDWNKLARSKK